MGARLTMETRIQNEASGHRRRLRERFRRVGLAGFSEVETIELLLTFAIPRRDVKPLARALLAHYGSVKAVSDAPFEELTRFPGVGDAAATLMTLLRELCTLCLAQEAKAEKKGELIDTGEKAARYFRMKLGSCRKESFMVVYLNAQNRYLAGGVIRGTVDHAHVYIREIAEKCLLCRASGVIVAHNHPSGVCDPSPEDIQLTRRLKTALENLNITLHDHLIVTASACRSFRAEGLL